jgi:hypothetical protein
MNARISRASMRSVIVLAAGILTVAIAPATAQAHEDGITTVASGLDNPRGLAFGFDGSLYVAEAGRGGSGPCLPGAEGGDVCFGTSGAVTKVSRGYQQRVLSGLPSLANPDGTRAIGPSDVAPKGDTFVFTVGLGLNPDARAKLPETGQDLGRLLRTSGHRGETRGVADLAGYEATANPDGGLPDSNPTSVAVTPFGTVATDAGGNSLVRIGSSGKVSTVAVFPNQLVDAPPFLGLPPGTKIPAQAVPTGVAAGPDGSFYVGQLTGFPFVPGTAKVFRVKPGHAPEVAADGFTNIIDVALGWDGSLYVLEIARNGLLSGDQSGALIKVDPDGEHHTVLDTGLTMPGGLAVRGDAAYVSNCGACPGAGTVVRVPLR